MEIRILWWIKAGVLCTVLENTTIITSTLSPSIPDPGETADLQYTVNNLVPETLYIFHIIARNEFGDSLSKSVKCATDESMYEVVYIICLYLIRLIFTRLLHQFNFDVLIIYYNIYMLE